MTVNTERQETLLSSACYKFYHLRRLLFVIQVLPQRATLCSDLCYSKSVCGRSSITFVRPTPGVETFGNISSSLCTLAILDPVQNFTEIIPGEPLRRGVKRKSGSKIER